MNINRSTAINNINIYKQNLKISHSDNKNIGMKKDTIEISKEARQISVQFVDNSDDKRNERIDSIKKSIKEDTYTINYEGLAKKILDKMRG